MGGKITGLDLPVRDFPCKTPAEVRETLPDDVDVVVFQCRNPVHRAHYELFTRALDDPLIGADGVVLVHPSGTVIFGLLLQNLVCLVTDNSGDVISLGRTACWVDKNNTIGTNERIIKGTCEEFVVSPVDGVTALEGDNINIIRKGLTDFRRCLTGEVTDGKVQAGDLSSHVVFSTFGGN